MASISTALRDNKDVFNTFEFERWIGRTDLDSDGQYVLGHYLQSTTKPLLRELGKRYLPAPVQIAPKRGFEVPLVRWLRGELRGLAADVILSRDGLLADWFDRTALEHLLRNAEGIEPARWSRQVWMLLVLGMWDRVVLRAKDHGVGTAVVRS